MLLGALFSAFICIFSVITIPVGTIPFTLSTFAVMLCALVLGQKMSMLSVLIYIFAGAIGIPVFSGFRAGIGVLIGPTGGYIWSYMLMSLVIGFFTKKKGSIFKNFAVCMFGLLVCYIFGTIQFMLIQKIDVMSAIIICILPFLAADALKAIAAAYIAERMNVILKKSQKNT